MVRPQSKTRGTTPRNWKEVIDLLVTDVGIPQNVIARYLGIDKATMSRLRRDPERLDAFMEAYPYQARLSRLVRALVDLEEARAVLLEGLGMKRNQPDPRSTAEFVPGR